MFVLIAIMNNYRVSLNIILLLETTYSCTPEHKDKHTHAHTHSHACTHTHTLPPHIAAAIGLAASLSLILRLTSSSSLCLIAAGGYSYLALIDINFNLDNSMYAYMWTGTSDQQVAMVLEAVINVACLFLSVWYVVCFWLLGPPLHSSTESSALTSPLLDQPVGEKCHDAV